MNAKLRPGLSKKPTSSVVTTDTDSTVTTPPRVAKPAGPRPKALVPGSVTAKVLARVWRGHEVTIVDSPPGAGKTSLVANVVANLATRTEMMILIALPTRAQCLALAHRLAEELPINKIKIAMKDVEPSDLPDGYNTDRNDTHIPRVTICTLAKAKFIDKSKIDVLVVDEAYQATHALVTQARGGVPQVLMVGDPGQIGPVVTVDTSIWQGQKDAPHLPAPLVTHGSNDVERFSLGVTYRLGPTSAKVVAPVYKFSLVSERPARSAVTSDGEVAEEIEAVEVEHSDEVDNLDCLGTVVRNAASFVGGALLEGDDVRPLRAEDIAIVVSRNSQVSIVTGMARSLGHDFIIGTADRLQGGEWPVVVALDPMYGTNGESEHNQSVGRLCVMVSRHTAHLTWVHDDSWIAASEGAQRVDKINRRVREQLTGQVAKEVDIFDAGI